MWKVHKKPDYWKKQINEKQAKQHDALRFIYPHKHHIIKPV